MSSQLLTTDSILLKSLLNDDNDSFLQLLYNNYKLINNKNENGETLLHYSAYYGLTEKFITLINMGAVVNKNNRGDNLLHYSALGGIDFFLFNQLIKDGFELTEPNDTGITPLHLCKNISAFSFAYQYLTMRDLKFKIINLIDNNGNNPAHIAIQNNHLDIYDFLLFEEPNIYCSLNFFHKQPMQVAYNPYLVCQQ